MLLIVDFWFCA